MTSATVAFSVGRAGSDGAAAAGVGCVLKNFIRVGPGHHRRNVSGQAIIVDWSRGAASEDRQAATAAPLLVCRSWPVAFDCSVRAAVRRDCRGELQRSGRYEKASLGASGVARVRVLCPWASASLPAGGRRRADERYAPAVVSTVSGRR